MKPQLKKSIGLLAAMLLLSFTLIHKHYISLTDIVYSEKEAALQITSRIFIDDLEDALEARYTLQAKLATPQEEKTASTYIEKYIRAKFAVALNGTPVAYTFLGKRYDNDRIICYMEIPDVQTSVVKTISVQNDILTDLFETQQNIVHLQWKTQKKSFVLQQENNKGMLKL